MYPGEKYEIVSTSKKKTCQEKSFKFSDNKNKKDLKEKKKNIWLLTKGKVSTKPEWKILNEGRPCNNTISKRKTRKISFPTSFFFLSPLPSSATFFRRPFSHQFFKSIKAVSIGSSSTSRLRQLEIPPVCPEDYFVFLLLPIWFIELEQTSISGLIFEEEFLLPFFFRLSFSLFSFTALRCISWDFKLFL